MSVTNNVRVAGFENILLPEDPSSVVVVQFGHHGMDEFWSLVLLLLPIASIFILAVMYVVGLRSKTLTGRINLAAIMKCFIVVTMLVNTIAFMQCVAGSLDRWIQAGLEGRPIILVSGLAIGLKKYAFSLMVLVGAILAMAHLRRRCQKMND